MSFELEVPKGCDSPVSPHLIESDNESANDSQNQREAGHGRVEVTKHCAGGGFHFVSEPFIY